MKPFTEENLIDYLSGELTDDTRDRLESTLKTDPDLADQLTELVAMQAWLVTAEEPVSETTEASILAFAEQEMTKLQKPALGVSWSRWASIAAAALMLFTAGWYFGQGKTGELAGELADIRGQVEELMQDQRSSARMRAVSMTHDISAADPALLEQLGRLLREDDSPNVRLAALNALTTYPNDDLARRELINSLEEDLPAVVQIQLIEALVALEEVRVLPQLKGWSKDESMPTHLRDAAQLASLKLARI